jgi:3-oxoacyl-[acyl-carrier-protein] synthase II
MRAISSRNDDPQRASRPWDKDRDGFVLSEGSAFVVLEDYEKAKKRGAKIYAEIVGYGMSGDAFHITQPSEDGYGAYLAIKRAAIDAKINAADISYINAHGTSTPLGDIAEVNAIKKFFGDSGVSKLNVSSTKSMTGHLLGAAGSIETIITALTLSRGIIPPTINLDNIDERCTGINLTPKTAVERKDMTYALNNSFGFGGTNCSLLLKKI